MKITLQKHLKPTIICLGLLVIIRVYLGLFQNAFIDDAFITFQYARNLRDHLTWGFFPGVTTNTATSPLNVILTALMGVVFKDFVEAAVWLATLEVTALSVLLLRLSKRMTNNLGFGIVGIFLTLGNPLLISTFGLETLLFGLLVVLSLYLFENQRWLGLALSLAALVLTRPDGLLLFVIMFGFTIRKKIAFTEKIRFLILFVVTLMPWYLFSWIQLGSLLPDTFLLKVNQNWQGLHYVFGIGLYLFKYPLATILALIAVPLGILGMITKRKEIPPTIRALFWFGVSYFCAYSLLRVPPYHWYYTPVAVSINLVGIWIFTQWFQPRRFFGEQNLNRKTVLPVASVILSLSLVGFLILQEPLQEMPIHSNWATQQQYQEIGNWLKNNLDPSAKIKLNGEIGTLAFYSERVLIDMFSCRYEQQLDVNQFLQRDGLIRLLAQINFFWFDPGEPCWQSDYLLGFDQRRASNSEEIDYLMEWPINTAWSEDKRVVLWPQETDK